MGIRQQGRVYVPSRKCESTLLVKMGLGCNLFWRTLESGTPRLYLDFGYGLFLQ